MDLPPAQIVVQSCHAVADAARHFISTDLEHPHFVVCGVKNELELSHAHSKIQTTGIQCCAFLEADIDNQMTAVATEPIYGEQRKHFRNFQLLKMGGTQ
jgi:hypothetical protein